MNKRAIHLHSRFSSARGFSILEVLIGIFIFAVGLLALSSLQGALTRSMADAKVRTGAVNVAERTIESHRNFTQLISDIAVPPTFIAYNDIVDSTTTETVNGVTYTVATDVTDYFYDISSDGFSTTDPAGGTALHSTYKQVEVTVSWDASQNFRGDEGTEIAAATLGSGQVVLTASIPALVTSASAMVGDESEGKSQAPDVSYQPGANPDIIALSLGENKFKESLLPEPDVIRAEELVETRFDVITYSQTDAGALFLRREEFATVSCECELQAPDADVTAHRPVIWAGDEYARGQHALKPYGVSASSQQSYLCDTCCRDHHDGGRSVDPAVPDHGDTAVNTYVPFKPASEFVTSGTFRGDHKHYNRTRAGMIEAASSGDTYVEACRLVRQDGFFRVMQDFRREDLHVFPADFLDDTNEIDVYSDFVTGAASAYAAASYPDYELNPPCIGPSPCTIAPAPKQAGYDEAIVVDDAGNPTQLPSWTTLPLWLSDLTLSNSQQLRSRGMYIDYLSYDLRTVLTNCVGDIPPTDDRCKSGDVELDRTGSTNRLELIPFFDVQLTKLTRWNTEPIDLYVKTTNEPLEDQNAHSRGLTSKLADGRSSVVAEGSKGNLGFTDTLPIDPTYELQISEASIAVITGTATSPPADGRMISGQLSELVAGDPVIIVTGLGGARCGQTSASYWCVVPDDAANPKIEISGYGKKNADRFACSVGSIFTADATGTVTNGENAKATYDIRDEPSGDDYNFVIQAIRCPLPIPISPTAS